MIDLLFAASLHPWKASIAGIPTEFQFAQWSPVLRIGQFNGDLQTQHLVSALFKVGRTLAGVETLHALYAGIIVNNRVLGFVQYKTKTPQLGSNGSLNDTDIFARKYILTNFTTGATDSSSNSLSRRSSQTVVYPEDPRFEMTFELHSTHISPGQMFTAFVDAIAITAQYESDDTGHLLAAYSADRLVSILMRGGESFAWGNVKVALKMLWRQAILGFLLPRGQLFEDTSFVLRFDGGTVAEGEIIVDSKPIPSPETAVARQWTMYFE